MHCMYMYIDMYSIYPVYYSSHVHVVMSLLTLQLLVPMHGVQIPQ